MTYIKHVLKRLKTRLKRILIVNVIFIFTEKKQHTCAMRKKHRKVNHMQNMHTYGEGGARITTAMPGFHHKNYLILLYIAEGRFFIWVFFVYCGAIFVILSMKQGNISPLILLFLMDHLAQSLL